MLYTTSGQLNNGNEEQWAWGAVARPDAPKLKHAQCNLYRIMESEKREKEQLLRVSKTVKIKCGIRKFWDNKQKNGKVIWIIT